jgi:hypothetical protein
MNYQLNFFYYRSHPYNVKIWIYARVFTLLLLLNTLGVAFNITLPVLSGVNAIVGCALIFVLLQINNHRTKVPFIKIQGDKMEYFCQEQNEVVSISADDITKITTRFCELKIHTNERVHSLNLAMISQEKKRWEIKEMIHKIAHIDRLSVAS